MPVKINDPHQKWFNLLTNVLSFFETAQKQLIPLYSLDFLFFLFFSIRSSPPALPSHSSLPLLSSFYLLQFFLIHSDALLFCFSGRNPSVHLLCFCQAFHLLSLALSAPFLYSTSHTLESLFIESEQTNLKKLKLKFYSYLSFKLNSD